MGCKIEAQVIQTMKKERRQIEGMDAVRLEDLEV